MSYTMRLQKIRALGLGFEILAIGHTKCFRIRDMKVWVCNNRRHRTRHPLHGSGCVCAMLAMCSHLQSDHFGSIFKLSIAAQQLGAGLQLEPSTRQDISRRSPWSSARMTPAPAAAKIASGGQSKGVKICMLENTRASAPPDVVMTL